MAGRRFDPDRRDRIIDAAIEVLSEEGVAGTSHRKVAQRADVPLGSMTYHFENMDELLREAFTRFATSVSDQFEVRLGAARTADEARDAVVQLIEADLVDTQRDLVLTHELYTLAAKDETYRDLTQQWMARSRAALEKHFDPLTAQVLDATIEGLTIHRALSTTRPDRSVTETAVNRLLRA